MSLLLVLGGLAALGAALGESARQRIEDLTRDIEKGERKLNMRADSFNTKVRMLEQAINDSNILYVTRPANFNYSQVGAIFANLNNTKRGLVESKLAQVLEPENISNLGYYTALHLASQHNVNFRSLEHKIFMQGFDRAFIAGGQKDMVKAFQAINSSESIQPSEGFTFPVSLSATGQQIFAKLETTHTLDSEIDAQIQKLEQEIERVSRPEFLVRKKPSKFQAFWRNVFQ